MLSGTRVDPTLEDRILALEEARDEAPPATVATARTTPDVDQPVTPSDEPFTTEDKTPSEPSRAEVRRFLRLQQMANEERKRMHAEGRLRKALAAAGLEHLSDDQFTEIQAAHEEFQPRVQEIWTEVKMQAEEIAAAGGTVDGRELRTTTAQQISTEFAEVLTHILPVSDAEAVASAVFAPHRK